MKTTNSLGNHKNSVTASADQEKKKLKKSTEKTRSTSSFGGESPLKTSKRASTPLRVQNQIQSQAQQLNYFYEFTVTPSDPPGEVLKTLDVRKSRVQFRMIFRKLIII